MNEHQSDTRPILVTDATWQRELGTAAQANPTTLIDYGMAQRITDLNGAFSERTVPLIRPARQALGDPPMSFSEFVRQNPARCTAGT